MHTISKNDHHINIFDKLEKMLMDLPKCDCHVCSHTKEFVKTEIGEKRFKTLWNLKIAKDLK